MRIADIEGIGDQYAAKLQEAGIGSVEQLLETAGPAKGRADLAGKCGVSEKLLLEWVNRADLARIKGIGSEFADLLEGAGVDSVPELAQRNAANLAAAMAEVNEKKKLTRRVPTEALVADWISQAKALPRAVTH